MNLILRRTLIIISLLILVATPYAVSTILEQPPVQDAVWQLKEPKRRSPVEIYASRSRTYKSSLVIEKEMTNAAAAQTYLVSYDSDGFKQYAKLKVPQGTKPLAGWPVIIIAHGYITPAAYQTEGDIYGEYMDAFVEQGYAVFRPDYRGHGRSKGLAQGAYFSPSYSIDVANLIAGLPSLPLFNFSQVGLWGHSMGGHVALRTAVIQPSVKGVVLVAGAVGSAQGIYRDWQPNSINAEPAAQSLRRRMFAKHGTYDENPAFWRAAAPLEAVRHMSAAVQLHHAGGDTQVPAKFSRDLASELNKYNRQYEYHEYEGSDHSFNPPLKEILIKRSISFFNHYIRDGKTSSGE